MFNVCRVSGVQSSHGSNTFSLVHETVVRVYISSKIQTIETKSKIKIENLRFGLYKKSFFDAPGHFRFSATACSKYCFCSLSLVKIWFNSVISATARSATSLTTLTLLITARPSRNETSRSQSSGSASKNAVSTPMFSKKIRVAFDTKSSMSA